MSVTSPLEKLKDLIPEPPDAKEVQGLIKAGASRLKDASNASNSIEGRFDLAYNASHSLCLAALRIKGFRPKNRFIVFQVLPHTLGLGPEVWRVLAKAHDIRNRIEYEGDSEVEERLVIDLVAATRVVATELERNGFPRPRE